ncbi:MAG TPA: hypothetical protein VKA37_04025 [Halobacteriales archaeon]|nr:hypothetical protein [Halobacteriales archaeon]
MEGSSSIRKKILSILIDRGEVTRTELAEQVAGDSSITTPDTRHLEIVLHHKHLPKLDQESYLEYDHRTGVVVRSLDPFEIKAQLEK